MQASFRTWNLPDADATTALARRVAPRLARGDTLLLSGDIGAGKSTFARALIQFRLGRQEDVPSPTFTLVQVYDHDAGDLWHCDLYRLTDTSEVFELGLDDAFESAICLIEWPDRLGTEAPATALSLMFTAGEAGHTIAMSGNADWAKRLGALDA